MVARDWERSREGDAVLLLRRQEEYKSSFEHDRPLRLPSVEGPNVGIGNRLAAQWPIPIPDSIQKRPAQSPPVVQHRLCVGEVPILSSVTVAAASRRRRRRAGAALPVVERREVGDVG